MAKVVKITHPHAWELHQSRLDESIVTGRPMVERPWWYEHTETGQRYHDLYGCIGWPTEVSDKDEGMPGYVAVVAVVKSTQDRPAREAAFRLMAEGESKDIPSLLGMALAMRAEYGFGLHPDLMQSFIGDPDRFITTLALFNEGLQEKGQKPVLVSPPVDYMATDAFDQYVRSLQSAIMPGRVRFYFGGNEILKNKLREFRRDNPAVMAIGGLVHTLLHVTLWMDDQRQNAFTVEEGNNV